MLGEIAASSLAASRHSITALLAGGGATGPSTTPALRIRSGSRLISQARLTVDTGNPSSVVTAARQAFRRSARQKAAGSPQGLRNGAFLDSRWSLGIAVLVEPRGQCYGCFGDEGEIVNVAGGSAAAACVSERGCSASDHYA